MKTNAILNEITAGRRMTSSEFVDLYRQADIFELGRAASFIRDQRYPENNITFIIDRNINYTNICSCQCRFCAFYREKEAPDAYVIDQRLLNEKIEEAINLGATQLMIQGGLNQDLNLNYFEQMFREIKSRYNITLHSLTAPEIVFYARQSEVSVKEALHRLHKAGLDSLPGGGAEILHDAVRTQISPNKITSSQWLEVMQAAHEIGLKTTATMMIGSVETIEQRVHHLNLIRNMQDEQPDGFRAFIVWTYKSGNNELPGNHVSSWEYLRFLALCRLYLDNFDHIQGSWVTQGSRIGQLSLYFGADDLGSIMLEENVVRSAGVNNRIALEEMVDLIRAAGKIPAIRDTAYNILQVL